MELIANVVVREKRMDWDFNKIVWGIFFVVVVVDYQLRVLLQQYVPDLFVHDNLATVIYGIVLIYYDYCLKSKKRAGVPEGIHLFIKHHYYVKGIFAISCLFMVKSRFLHCDKLIEIRKKYSI